MFKYDKLVIYLSYSYIWSKLILLIKIHYKYLTYYNGIVSIIIIYMFCDFNK